MRHDSFAALILTHGRPDRVYTYKSLRRAGYTGRIVIVIDNEDARADEYRREFGDQVVMFDKAEIAARFDEGDNFRNRRTTMHVRNATFEIARELGVRHFVQLDDDYTDFRHKTGREGEFIHCRWIRDLDGVFDALIDYFEAIPALSIAMAQGGDFIGGKNSGAMKVRRKVMNSFICSTERPFGFVGRLNEDVNTYVTHGARGALFLTIWQVALQQKATQANAGGMTDAYLAAGTYVKSFYTVMMQPSSVRVSVLATTNPRIHHRIDWRRTVPMILPESARKPGP